MAEILTTREQLAIFERDGWRCQRCRLSGAYEPGKGWMTANGTVLSVDHIDPKSAGGGHDPANLVTLCMACNRAKWTGPPLPSPPRSAQRTPQRIGDLARNYLNRYRKRVTSYYLEPAVSETADSGAL